MNEHTDFEELFEYGMRTKGMDLSYFCQQLEGYLSEKVAKILFFRFDRDRDGKVTIQEIFGNSLFSGVVCVHIGI